MWRISIKLLSKKKLLAGGCGNEMSRSYLPLEAIKQINKSFNKIPGERRRGHLFKRAIPRRARV